MTILPTKRFSKSYTDKLDSICALNASLKPRMKNANLHNPSPSINHLRAYPKSTPLSSSRSFTVENPVTLLTKAEIVKSVNSVDGYPSILGIDREDIVPLYDSPPPSDSSEDEFDTEDKIDTCRAPVLPLRTRSASTMTLNQIGEDFMDIPIQRRELYKDCFTLFLENWFSNKTSL